MQVDYYYSFMSPWAYLGANRFYELQQKYKFKINHYPLDILKLFSLSGGKPLAKRADQRKAYRMMELKRWQKKLNLPLNLEPKYFPPSDVVKASCIVLSIEDQKVQNEISLFFLQCVWVEDKDIGNIEILEEACLKCNLNFKSLMLEQGNMLEKFNNLAPIAAKNNVFGSPSYVVNDEVFWGQDRLELFEKAIKKIIK